MERRRFYGYSQKQKGESEDKLINRFKKEVLNEGIVFEARERKEI